MFGQEDPVYLIWRKLSCEYICKKIAKKYWEKVEKGNNEESQNTQQVICKFSFKRHELRCCLLQWNRQTCDLMPSLSHLSSHDLSLRNLLLIIIRTQKAYQFHYV